MSVLPRLSEKVLVQCCAISRRVLVHLQQGIDICSSLELLLDAGLRAASKGVVPTTLSSGDFPRCSVRPVVQWGADLRAIFQVGGREMIKTRLSQLVPRKCCGARKYAHCNSFKLCDSVRSRQALVSPEVLVRSRGHDRR